MSGTVPPPPPPRPASQGTSGDPSRSPARPERARPEPARQSSARQAPPSFAPGAASGVSASSPGAAQQTQPQRPPQSAPQPWEPAATQQHAPVPPAPQRQPVYSVPPQQQAYPAAPPAYAAAPQAYAAAPHQAAPQAYAAPPRAQAHPAPAPVHQGPPTTQNPAVRRRKLSPGWIAFIVVDVVLVVAMVVVAFQALSGPTPQVEERGDQNVAAAPSDGAEGAAEAEDDATGPGATVAEFAAPSRNITCEIFERGASCGIAELDQQPAPVESCEGTTGYVVDLDGEGKVSLPCVASGDKPGKAPEDLQQLAYGESITEGDYTCESRQDGMRCTHDPSGNGFSLARAGIGTS